MNKAPGTSFVTKPMREERLEASYPLSPMQQGIPLSGNDERPMLTDDKLHQPLAEGNSTLTQYSREKCIHGLFEEQAEATPEAIAIVYEEEQLTYGELNRRANQLAHYLQGLGVGPEMPVALCVERSVEMVIGLLGILKAGGAYVPLDPQYPQERLSFMLKDAGVRVLLTQEKLSKNLRPHAAEVICLDSDWTRITCQRNENPQPMATAQNLAYVIYTSGSTGTPKGVSVNHSSVVHLFDVMRPVFAFGGGDVWTVSHSYAFDFSVWEIFGALLSGGRLVMVPLRVAQSALDLYELLRTERVTVLSLTPAALRQLVQTGKPVSDLHLRLVIGGGDAFPSDLAPDLLRWDVPVWNFYGPTEGTVWAIVKPVEAKDVEFNTVPVGKPMADIQAYLLDQDLRPVPAGVAGELHLGGAGLARGYFKRPELTAQRFIPNPFSSQPGARLYKTGDLGRYLANGDIQHLGRIDHQVKLRGFRIELEEIEAVLAQHTSVDQCIVTVREDQPGERRLVAYLAHVPGSKPNIGELLSLAKAKLPEYMVPAAFVILERLPLTPNGKVDRLSLPAPAQTRPDLNEAYVAPRTPEEETLAELWAAVLSLDRVGMHDNFFELGGHSLLATKMISRVRDTFQVELSLSDTFESPTVAELAGKIERKEVGGLFSRIQPVSRDGHLPLSFPQERIWFIQQLFPDTRAYNFQSTLRLTGVLDVPALEGSLNEIVRRHEIFRTTFPSVDGRPTQVIHEPWPVKLSIDDLEMFPKDEREAVAERRINEELEFPFDLNELPLIRWRLFRLNEREHILLHVEHHLVHDGWSFNVFLNELLKLYESFSAGKPSPLPDLPVQFADFACWQRQWMQGDVARGQLDYWREKLAGSSAVLELPTDRPRPAVQSFRGGSYRVELPLELCQSLRKLSRGQGVTLFMLFLSAFEAFLYRYTSQEQFCVGSTVANRRWPETEDLIGMIVNSIALPADLSENPTFSDLLMRVRRSAVEAYSHQDLPFDLVVDALHPERDLSRNPLFQVMLNFHDAPLPELKLPELEIELVEVVSNKSAKFDLQLIAIPRFEQQAGLGSRAKNEGITLIWEYSTDLFDYSTVTRMMGHFKTLLEGVVANPDQPISELPLLTTAECDLLAEWNETRRDYAEDHCLHELFEAQVARTPDNVALVFGEQRLSYKQLNARSNKLAHYLRKQGVGPDVLVGIFGERCIEMVVGVLGILKAGGAYVPLDPAYPPDRIAFMLHDAGVSVLLAENELLKVLPPTEVRVIPLDSDWETSTGEDESNPESRVSPQNLAYVIYTSGSTGEPKGVAIEHRSTVAFLNWTSEAFSREELQSVLASTSLCFDLSVFELFAPLSVGGEVVLVENALCLPDLRSTERVTLVNTVPSAMAELVRLGGIPASVLTVNLAGEPLANSLVQQIYKQETIGQVVNLYGPSEDTTYSTFARMNQGVSEEPSIGRPIANTQVYLLDSHLQPVPVGVPGELCLGGDGLARGYLNRSALTAEKFIPNEFSKEAGARLYRTGDLARYQPGGTIQFLGRVDHQVKVRGFRIELGEIEAVLSEHPAVEHTIVVVREDIPGNKQIVSYVVAEENESWVNDLSRNDEDSAERDPAPDSALLKCEGNQKSNWQDFLIRDLKRFLKQKLPGYMLPATYVLLDELPVTPNGKVDRGALPRPDRPTSDPEQFVFPRTPAEERLCDIWIDLLKVDRVGVFDNFFELGGHSLLATRVVSRVSDTFEIRVPLRAFFDRPTVAGLADFVANADKEHRETIPAIKRIPRA